MKLVVVESPAKVKTIRKYLGRGYKVAASMGHLVDLPKKELGVDVDKDFEPEYVVTNKKALKVLKDEFKRVNTLVIASDPDREGEAIGWHVAQQLGVISKKGRHRKDTKKKLERIVFTSITKNAVLKAVDSPRSLDLDLIDAQQARRILDRLVGYKLSPLLWKKVMYGLSAGRVQSVAVRLIVDREEEREKFKPCEYWTITADLSVKKIKRKPEKIYLEKENREDRRNKKVDILGVKFELVKIGKKKASISDRKSASKIMNTVDAKEWIISDISIKESFRNPKPPFITSTLQRIASSWYGYSAKRTMSIAQKLYERGHISYMRTDSTRIVASQIKEIRTFIERSIGEDYLREKVARYKTSARSAQEAHEAIRPTRINKDSSSIGLHADEKKLYDLIRGRTLASQMKPAKIERNIIQIQIMDYLFQSNGQRVLFDGYLKVYPEKVSENILPKLTLKQQLYPTQLISQQHFTEPPPRYSEATLIKALEEFGIGRPSTYAPIISTILARKYVEKEGKYLIPTDTGKVVTRLLKKHFAGIVDTGFTAGMETDLDDIANGKKSRVKVIKEFYKPFIKRVKVGEEKIKREDYTVLGPSKYKCPKCGKKMVRKLGKFGEFHSCKDFPRCDGIRSIEGESEEQKEKKVQKEARSEEFKRKYLVAPETSDGTKMVLKEGKYGKFWAHPDYPKVKETSPLLLKVKCPRCKSPLVERKGRWGKMFIGCSGYPKCNYIKKNKRTKRSNRSLKR